MTAPSQSVATAYDACAACTTLAATLAPGERATCPACGGELTRAVCAAVRHAQARPARRARPPGSPVDDREVRQLIGAVLRQQLQIERVERAAHGSGSPLLTVLRAIELGFYGHGCKGTKGVLVGHTRDDEPPAGADPEYDRRYRALDRRHQVVLDAIAQDGHGDQVASLALGEGMKPAMALPLEARIGLRLASAAQFARWLAKVRVKDSGTMVAGASALGTRALRDAALAWRATGGPG